MKDPREIWGYTGCRMAWAIQVDATHPERKGQLSAFRDSAHCIDAPEDIPLGYKFQHGCPFPVYAKRGESLQ